MNEYIIKRLCTILDTGVDNIVPSIKKIMKDVEAQKNEIKKLKEKLGD